MLKKPHIIYFYKLNCYRSNTSFIPIEIQVILTNNGSLTQNLNSITGHQIGIQLINQRLNNNQQLIRTVVIKNHYNIIVFAESQWDQYNHKKNLFLSIQPIGQSIILNEIDIYKEVCSIYCGYHYNQQEKLNTQHAIYCKQNIIWYQKIPLTIINEFFNLNLLNNLYTYL